MKTIVYTSNQLVNMVGGAEKSTQQLLQGLTDYNHVFIGSNKVWFKMFKDLGHEVILSTAGFEPVNFRNLLLAPFSFILSLRQTLKFKKIYSQADILISTMPSFTEVFFLFPFIKLLYKTPILYIVRGNHCPRSIYKNPLLFIFKKMWQSDTVVFVSNSIRDDWKKRNIIPKKSLVIYNGIKTQPAILISKNEIGTDIKVNLFRKEFLKHSEQIETNLDKKLTEVNFGFLGRIHPEKGLATVLKALTLVQLKNFQINLNIGGNGEYLNSFKTLQFDLKFPENLKINWLGFVDSTDNFYKQQNVMLFPSIKESFGRIMIEAWSYGLPVISSNIGALSELKAFSPEPEQNLVFESENPQNLAEKINYFLRKIQFYNSPEYRRELQRTVENNFSIDKTISNYRDVILHLQSV